MRLLLWVPVAALAFTTQPRSWGQAPFPSLLGAGYRIPSNTMTAAPGQALLVSVRGIQPLPQPLEAAGPSIAAEVVQGAAAESIPLEIQTLQQTRCAPVDTKCQPITSLLVAMPLTLRDAAVLKIRENGAVVSEIKLRRVEDAIHLINSCDEVRPPFEDAAAAADPPSAGPCTTPVGSRRGPVGSRDNPARAGDPLFVWVYGLGAVDGPFPVSRPPEPELFPRVTQPITINFTFAGDTPLAERHVTGVTPTYAALTGSYGLYQVNFELPPVPPTTPECSEAGDFNVTITIVGTDSADSARICVAR